MNKLNTFLSFVLLSFCLLINVSYAEIPANTEVAIDTDFSFFNVSTFGDYSADTLLSYFSDYYNKDDETSLATLLSIFSDAGFSRYVISRKTDGNNSYIYLYFLCDGNDVGYLLDGNGIPKNAYYSCDVGTQFYRFYIKGSTKTFGYISSSTNKYRSFTLLSSSPTMSYEYDFSSEPIKLVTLRITDTSQYYITWDGTSYYYEVPTTPDEPEEPIMPTNSEIAQAVQAFYNSDYYKNNKDFEDFIVLYNYDTQYFSFIGHNFGIDLGQVIVPPDYEYEGYSYKQDWWKFFLRNISSELASNLWNRYYWLYSTNDFGQNITNDGKGSIKDLINLHFSTKSVIVYSTTDYPVVKIETDENGVLTPVEGTVPGDQYTYDENLDPTTNEYNPLENFVPTNPTQNILGDVDFDEINKTFEENKDILNIEGASWLFTANNQFVGYFIGFLSLLIVFLIISRILGG